MKGLLLTRIRKDYDYQYGVIKTAIDWTVIVYLILPGLFFTGLFYRSLWVEPPVWFNWFDWRLAALAMAITMLSSKWRTFLYEADSVFLIKRKELIESILKESFIYNLVYSLVETGLVVVLVCPFIVNFLNISWYSILAFWISMACVKVFGKSMFYFAWLRFKGWRLRAAVISIGIVIFLSTFLITWLSLYIPLAAALPLVMLIILLPVLLKNSLLSPNRILDHGIKERGYKTRFIKKMFSMSYEVETPPKAKTRSKPWFFRKSGRIFKQPGPQKAMAELFIKHYARNREYTYIILRLMGAAGASAIFVPSAWAYLIIVSFLAFGAVSVSQQMWAQLIDQHAIGVKYKSRDAYFKIKRKTDLITVVPYTVFLLLYFI
ncbi:ABC transporter permease [Jeotgalibacillus haloalkalitolerans]|uniref:ABC transporter permease n=1 Tax=Jeotgalibacillus haloalkalitolerans TaxID=3104292 RepID=A0ABU5KPA7_9BACL|nr:ABC transporter permease [Jeotgalibacillus sp. HH7-29]MDZ5712530.1 ABC transporter permease [Jeotgalibacillus sp. HH7-29]